MTSVTGDANTYGQSVARQLSAADQAFICKIAVPHLAKVETEETLSELARTFWKLCTWENDRAKMLDGKASSLLGTSGIAAVVVGLGGSALASGWTPLLFATCASLALFAATVFFCLLSLAPRKYGSFNDEDVFASICANESPVGDVPSFNDENQHSCFMKETILQRWLIYRWHSDMNDRRFKWLRVAQILAMLAVASLFLHLAFIWGVGRPAPIVGVLV